MSILENSWTIPYSIYFKMIMYESDWKWWSQSTNHWDGAIAGKLEKGGLSYWPEYRGLTKHHNWAIHGNIKNQDFLTSQVCVCVCENGGFRFHRNMSIQIWRKLSFEALNVWDELEPKKTSRGGAIQFSMKIHSFFHWCPSISKKTSMFRYLKRNITSFFSGTLARSTVFRNV